MLISQFKLIVCMVTAGKKRWIWIGAAIATALLILCSLILCLAKKKQKYALKGIWILCDGIVRMY